MAMDKYVHSMGEHFMRQYERAGLWSDSHRAAETS